jgi:hypothetical protein
VGNSKWHKAQGVKYKADWAWRRESWEAGGAETVRGRSGKVEKSEPVMEYMVTDF